MLTLPRNVSRFLFSERILPEYAPEQRRIVARYTAAADVRLHAQHDLGLPLVVRADLLRVAVALLARAASAGRKDGAPYDAVTTDGATMLKDLRADEGYSTHDDPLRVDAAMTATDPLHFDSLEESELESVIDALTRETRWLRGQIDLRSATHVRATKVGRMIALALLVAYGLYALGALAFAPRNLALHKAVQVSSQQPGTPEPSGLVDGKKGEKYGLHTDVSGHDPWALVDLQSEVPVRKIVVYNRGDLNLDDGLPYALDLSLDGHDFHEVARCDTHFGDGGFFSPPWTVKLHERARYVRVRAKGYIALNELEVF